MTNLLEQEIDPLLRDSAAAGEAYATTLIDGLLKLAVTVKASDLHLQPTARALELAWRIDGVLHRAGHVPRGRAVQVLGRLKVLAGLLTYKTGVPQEGRLRDVALEREFRVSTFPTLYGEKAVIRLMASSPRRFEGLDELQIAPATVERLRTAARATSGAILLVGPAGSGKTTTAYTLLREILHMTGGGRSMTSLEDPVEMAVEGVAQSQVNPAVGFDLLTALRSLVRQDPEVILVGEIRDAEVAQVAYQAAMTGQLVVTTFHAGDAADALVRLLDMGIPPYIVRGATQLVVAQRLLRRLCPCGVNDPGRLRDTRDTSIDCDNCRGTGYSGRVPVTEAVRLETPEVARALLRHADAQQLRGIFAGQGETSLRDEAHALVEAGQTTQAELFRVLGLSNPPHERQV